MLDTMREYALERLAERIDAAAIRERHAAFYLDLAQEAEPQLRGPAEAAWLDRLEAEHDNLRAALDWLAAHGSVERALGLGGALWRFWRGRGHLHEGYRRLTLLLSAPDAVARSAGRAEALFGAGALAGFLGKLRAARAHTAESLAIWRAIGDEPGVAWALMNLANYDVAAGHLASGQTNLEASRALFRRLGDRRGEAWVDAFLGFTRLLRGDGEAAAVAQATLAQSVAVFRDLGEQLGLALALSHLAIVEEERGRPDAALAHLRECLELVRAVEHEGGVLLAFQGLASFAAGQGQPERATRLGGAAAALQRVTGEQWIFDPSRRFERRLAAARQALGEHAFAAAWAEGQAMTLEQADAYALQCVRRRARPV
jgi:non-specific serine/threonine protein kinase